MWLVWSVFSALLDAQFCTVLYLKTVLLIGLDIFNSQSGSTKWLVLKRNTQSKVEHTIIWKSIENWNENWCQNVCAILFDSSLSLTNSDMNILCNVCTWSQIIFFGPRQRKLRLSPEQVQSSGLTMTSLLGASTKFTPPNSFWNMSKISWLKS